MTVPLLPRWLCSQPHLHHCPSGTGRWSEGPLCSRPPQEKQLEGPDLTQGNVPRPRTSLHRRALVGREPRTAQIWPRDTMPGALSCPGAQFQLGPADALSANTGVMGLFQLLLPPFWPHSSRVRSSRASGSESPGLNPELPLISCAALVSYLVSLGLQFLFYGRGMK